MHGLGIGALAFGGHAGLEQGLGLGRAVVGADARRQAELALLFGMGPALLLAARRLGRRLGAGGEAFLEDRLGLGRAVVARSALILAGLQEVVGLLAAGALAGYRFRRRRREGAGAELGAAEESLAGMLLAIGAAGILALLQHHIGHHLAGDLAFGGHRHGAGVCGLAGLQAGAAFHALLVDLARLRLAFLAAGGQAGAQRCFVALLAEDGTVHGRILLQLRQRRVRRDRRRAAETERGRQGEHQWQEHQPRGGSLERRVGKGHR